MFVKIKKLKKIFPLQKKQLIAVDDVSLDIIAGETLGLVGESGSGKSTLGKMLLGILKPTEGQIFFEGKDIFSLSKKELKEFRKKIQIIFQDPYSSLNPCMRVFEIIAEPLYIHGYPNVEKRVRKLLELVHLPQTAIHKFPHEFSGGERQRIGIARALALSPTFLVCDEPISALDVSIQAQIVTLLHDLQKELGLTYFFIAHDLSMIRYISSRVAVMHRGQIVEVGDTEEVFENPQDSYTKMLLSSSPSLTFSEHKSIREPQFV